MVSRHYRPTVSIVSFVMFTLIYRTYARKSYCSLHCLWGQKPLPTLVEPICARHLSTTPPDGGRLNDLMHRILRGGARDGSNDDNNEILPTEDLSKRRPYTQSILQSFPVSVCSIRGFRNYMEDELVIRPDFCAVFDGHGGASVSRYLRQNLYAALQAELATASMSTTSVDKLHQVDEEPNFLNENVSVDSENGPVTVSLQSENNTLSVTNCEQALLTAIRKIDKEVCRIKHWSFQGSTCLGLFFHKQIQDDNKICTLITANVGDSRAVLSRNSVAVDLTRDHKPSDQDEHDRIYRNGGYVEWCGDRNGSGEPIHGRGIYRVNGNMALSRAIGDQSERPAVSAEPEVTITTLRSNDDFIIVASDGLYDVMNSMDVVAFVHYLLDAGDEFAQLDDVASLLVEEALRRGSMDNITVLIIFLNP